MPLDLSRIRGLCFDIDGTLSDTDDAMVFRLNKLLRVVRWAFPAQDSKPFARWMVMAIESPGNFLMGIPDRFGLDDELNSLISAVQKRTAGKKQANFWIIPQVQETLEKLHPHFPMAVVSARNQEGTQSFLEQYHLVHFFHSIVTAQTCRYTKPYPDPILWAAQQMNVSPQDCLMIGDTTVDIRAGKAAGAQTVGVLCGFGTEKELRRAGADLIIPSPVHLIEVLQPLFTHSISIEKG